MESIVWLILGCIFLSLSLFIVCYTGITDKKVHFGHVYLSWVLGIFGVVAILGYARHQPFKSSGYKLTTEIRQELLNGKIISTDTIYKFAPKKK